MASCRVDIGSAPGDIYKIRLTCFCRPSILNAHRFDWRHRNRRVRRLARLSRFAQHHPPLYPESKRIPTSDWRGTGHQEGSYCRAHRLHFVSFQRHRPPQRRRGVHLGAGNQLNAGIQTVSQNNYFLLARLQVHVPENTFALHTTILSLRPRHSALSQKRTSSTSSTSLARGAFATRAYLFSLMYLATARIPRRRQLPSLAR